ncbi:MAG TPA: hypothetical protein VFM88_01150 [Vicinamibacteria bacterium]|nr:hypothetical protein [Vicinamibacteria bacterium]
MAELDLDRDLPTTAEDVEALHRLRRLPPMTADEYLRFLASFAPPSAEALRARPGPRGEPFTLPVASG